MAEMQEGLAMLQDGLYSALHNNPKAKEALGIEHDDDVTLFALALITPLAHVVKCLEDINGTV